MENPIKKAERKIGYYVLGAIVVLVIVFFAGTKFVVKSSVSAQSAGNRTTFTGMRSTRGTGIIFGNIIKMDAQSITVQSQDGSTKIIWLNNATKISKTVSGSTNDLVVGGSITVNGSVNSDGSITGQAIQLRTGSDFMMMRAQ